MIRLLPVTLFAYIPTENALPYQKGNPESHPSTSRGEAERWKNGDPPRGGGEDPRRDPPLGGGDPPLTALSME